MNLSLEGNPSTGSIYQDFCFSASATWNTWVKLTAADVYGLQTHPSCEGKDVWFLLNHPIRHVYLCGPVVAITFPANSQKFVLLTIDDGSGTTIDVKVQRKAIAKQSKGSSRSKEFHQSTSADDARLAYDKQHVWELDHPLLDAIESQKQPRVTDTMVDNVRISSACEDDSCFEQHVLIDGSIVDIGIVLKAKGTISEWKEIRQLDLLRVSLVRDTEEETQIWDRYTRFALDVLVKPWRLSLDRIEDLRRKANERKKQKAILMAKVEDRKRRREERQRDQEAETSRIQRQREEKRVRREAMVEESLARETEELDGNPLDRPKRE